MIDASDTVKIFIAEWRKDCKSMTPEQALREAQQYVYQLGAYDPIEIYKAIEILALASETTLEVLCQDPDFARFAEQTKTAIWAKEELAQGITQRAEYQDLSNSAKEILADIDDDIAKGATPSLIANRFSDIRNLTDKAASITDDDKDFEPSFDTLITQTANEKDGFIPATLAAAHVSCPDGTMSFIGAPTSRGKTAAMASIGIDALKDSDRHILFLTLEEHPKQILRRLVMCLAYRMASETERKALEKAGNGNPIYAWKLYAKTLAKTPGSENYTFCKEWKDYIPSAKDEVTAYMTSGRLAICNGEGRLFDKLLARASKMGTGDIIMYDYIQRLPGGIFSREDKEMRFTIQHINDQLLLTTKRIGAILLAGAQFNRTGGRVKKTDKLAWQEVGDDNLDDNLFAECGGIEKDAHIAIGIGGNANDNKRHFLKVLKNREGEKDAVYNLDFCGAFSYVKATYRLDTSTQAGSGGANTNSEDARHGNFR